MTDESPDKKDKYHDLIEQTRATRIQPGEVRNPAGRPPGIKYVSDYLREKLGKVKDGTVEAEAIADALIAMAKDTKMRGFVPALQELLNRTEGKVLDTHKIEGDMPVTIIFKPAEEQ